MQDHRLVVVIARAQLAERGGQIGLSLSKEIGLQRDSSFTCEGECPVGAAGQIEIISAVPKPPAIVLLGRSERYHQRLRSLIENSNILLAGVVFGCIVERGHGGQQGVRCGTSAAPQRKIHQRLVNRGAQAHHKLLPAVFQIFRQRDDAMRVACGNASGRSRKLHSPRANWQLNLKRIRQLARLG